MGFKDTDMNRFGDFTPRYCRWTMTAKTASYTVTTADFGTWFHTTGAAGAVTFTLPTAAAKWDGCWVRFTNMVDQDMIIDLTTDDTMITHHDAAADSVAYSTNSKQIGGTFEFVCVGSKWICVPLNWADGTLAQTITVATA